MLSGGRVGRVRDRSVRVLGVIALQVLVGELQPGLDVCIARVIEGGQDLDVGFLTIVLVREEARSSSSRQMHW